MKSLGVSLFNIICVAAIMVLVIIIVLPFNLINLEQAQRIAVWKSEYEKLDYEFSLVKLHEGKIVPDEIETGKVLSEEILIKHLKPYFLFTGQSLQEINRYSYKNMNGSPVRKSSQFYFNKFLTLKDGIIISFKKNEMSIHNENLPLFFMFIDINGKEKPNRIGRDIFFISIYKNEVNALGAGKSQISLKSNCSPIGSGLYCSQYYLLGGKF